MNGLISDVKEGLNGSCLSKPHDKVKLLDSSQRAATAISIHFCCSVAHN